MTARQLSFAPSLPAVDAALAPHTGPGNLILCAGLTGAGKTILAGQCAIGNAAVGRPVLFISTQVPREELEARTLSAFCDIPYDDIKDRIQTIQYEFQGARLHVPAPARYGVAATEKAVRLRETMVENYLFTEVESLGYEPLQRLNRIVDGYAAKTGRPPQVLVYDHLSNPRVTQTEIDPFQARQAVHDAAAALATVAKNRSLLVIAFCQADQSLLTNKKIMPGDIRDFGSIRELADGFVGVSKRTRPDVGVTGSEEIYDRVQHLTVVTAANPSGQLIPVETNFAYQRFEPFREKVSNAHAAPRPAVHDQARVVVSQSEFQGYVLARRAKLRQAFGCGSPYAVNLYAFLLLAAAPKGRAAGTSFYSRETLGAHLGLSSKQLRLATDFLMDINLIDVPVGKVRQSLRYHVEDWQSDQAPATRGYFKLFRNLRDRSRADLLGDPALFRAWLYLLNEARLFPDEAAGLEPGEALVPSSRAQELLGLPEAELGRCIQALEERGSCRRRGDEPNKVFLVNWDLYQHQVYASARGSKAH